MRKVKNLQFIPTDATYAVMKSPVGDLTIITSAVGLHAVLWDLDWNMAANKKMLSALKQVKAEKTLDATKKQLQEYFAGKRKAFDLPLAANGTTFQLAAWKQLSKIPYAKTISYGVQANKMGDKNKARAAGAANGKNPISIIVPCHRVIGANGKLVGFGGGLERKAYLLELEKKYAE